MRSRWRGDNALREALYAFAVRGMHWVVDQMDSDHDGWPEGLGNVERGGMGEEKLDVTTATIRGLYDLADLADLADSKGDESTRAWARSQAHAMESAFDAAWWMAEVPQFADLLDDPGGVKVQQRHWIGVTPMEIELAKDGRASPGLATFDHGNAALEVASVRVMATTSASSTPASPAATAGPRAPTASARSSRLTRR